MGRSRCTCHHGGLSNREHWIDQDTSDTILVT